MTTTDRRDATDAQFADELARLDRLDVADESAVERVARALWADDVRVYGNTVAMPSWESGEPDLTDDFRRLARAAIAALKPAPGTDTSGQAVQRDECPHNEDRESCAVGCAAVAGPQRDHDGNALGNVGRKVLDVLRDPASWKPGVVHDISARGDRGGGRR